MGRRAQRVSRPALQGISRSVRALQGVSRALVARAPLSNRLTPARNRHMPEPATAEAEVAEAWLELRAHPALSWVPPMWRSAESPTGMARHAVSAMDKNLTVDIQFGPAHHLLVRLTTGPLKDRYVGDGLDPLTPTVSVDPNLTVYAASFERAVIELRDAVHKAYGPADTGAALTSAATSSEANFSSAEDVRLPSLRPAH